MSVFQRKLVLGLALLPLLLGGCPQPNNEQGIVELRILTPLPNTIFGEQDDLEPPADNGVSTLVVVAAFVENSAGDLVAAPDDVTIRLRRNGGGEETSQTVNGQARFETFSLEVEPQQDFFLNSLVACADNDGTEVCSDPINVRTDILAPDCAIVVPANGETLVAGDDADLDLLNGFQAAEVIVATDAGNGTTVLLRVDGTNAGSAGVVGASARFTNVTLVAGEKQLNTLTAQCVDLAGNLGEGEIEVIVDVDIPTIQIVDPLSGTTITSNFDPANFSVQVATQFIEEGQTATLEADGNIQFGPVTIDANGEAVFNNVQLGEGNHTLQAFTQDSNGIPAESLVVDIIVNIEDVPPAATLIDPVCNGGVADFFAGDDIDGDPNNGFQTQAIVSSTGTDLDLEVDLAGGGTFTDSVQVNQGLGIFAAIDLEIGDNTVTITPFDAATNLSGSPVSCIFRVNENDFLTIIAPGEGAILGSPDDADQDISNGLQVVVLVNGSSGIADGTVIEIVVNGLVVASKAMNGGQVSFDGIDAVLLADEGSVTIEARAEIVPNIDPDTVTVTVDTQGPDQVADLVCNLDNARQGSVICTFTAPDDPVPGTGTDRYEVRLLENVVIDENNFDQAQIVAVITAGAPGGTEIISINGARPGPTYHVALISLDQANNRSEVSNDTAVLVNGVEAPVDFDRVAVNPPALQGFFGFTMDSAGDFNGDGIGDVVITSIGAAGNGEIYVYYGAAQDPALTFATPSLTIVGNGGFPGFGIAGIGDFDGDSISDIAIGAPFESRGGGTGVVYVFRGRTGGEELTGTISVDLADLIVINDPAAGVSNFGQTLGPAGDIDNDGRTDLLIGAIGFAQTNIDEGAAYLIYGLDLNVPQTITLPNGLGAEFHGLATGDLLGTSLNGVGDINNDNFDDIAIGAIQDDAGTDTGPGYVAVFLGGTRPAQLPVGANSLDRDDAFSVLVGLGTSVSFGAQVVGAGSLDGDNTPSVAVSDPDANAGAGTVFVFDNVVAGTLSAQDALDIAESGNNTDVVGLILARGASLGGAGENDIDGDGLSDLLVMSFTFGANPGAAFLFYGDDDFFAESSRDALLADGIFVSDDMDDFSEALQYIGDINGDGFVDFALGDSNTANPAAFDGVVTIFF